MVIGVGVMAGGGIGGGGGLGDSKKSLEELLKLLQSSDPALTRFNLDISMGLDPITSLNDGLQLLGQTGIDTLSDALPASIENTLAAFGRLQQQPALDAVNSLVMKLGTTTVDQFGTAMPQAADVSGQSLTLLQAVAQRLKASGLDPAHVSVGDLNIVLGALRADIPGLNAVIQSFTDKLNAIPRNVQVSIGTLGAAAGSGGGSGGGSSSGGGQLSSTETGNGGQPSGPYYRGGVNSGVKQFAAGGWPDVGMPSLIGENGPELFVPSVPGQIIPNDDLRGVRGGGMTVIVQVSGVMDLTNPTEVSRLADTVGNAVMRNIRTRTGLGRVM
jgi:hypothetical protein